MVALYIAALLNVVGCADRVEGPPGWPYAGWRPHAVIAGPIAFVGLRNAPGLSPALVRAGRRVTVIATTPGVEMVWHRRAKGFTFQACPGRRTQFLGGFSADRRTCATIDVFAGERYFQRRFSLGKRCN
jgi:hypothetical protein